MYVGIVIQSNVPKGESGKNIYYAIPANERAQIKNISVTEAEKWIKKAKRERYVENYPTKGVYSTLYIL